MKEKTADEMFEELGYTVQENKYNIFILDENENMCIIIHKESKSITFYKVLIEYKLLQAINKKVEEMEWK